MSGVRSTESDGGLRERQKKKHAQGRTANFGFSSFLFNKCADNTLSADRERAKRGRQVPWRRGSEFLQCQTAAKEEKKKTVVDGSLFLIPSISPFAPAPAPP